MAEKYFILQIHHVFFTYSSTEGHVSCFQFLGIISRAAMNMVEQVSLWSEKVYFEVMPKSGITES